MNKPIRYMTGLGAGVALALGVTWGVMNAGETCPAGEAAAKGTACCASDSACGAMPVSLETAEVVSDVAACPVSLEKTGSGSEGAACPVESATKLTSAQYKVKGMSCGACEGKVAQSLSKVAGVSEPKACSESGVAKVAYDSSKVKKEQLVGAIRAAGFEVEGEMVELKVNGMSCGACSSKVSKALTGLKGVREEKVSHETKVAVVTFDPESTNREAIVAAIDKTGFKVVP
jgi:copper ion binding protein